MLSTKTCGRQYIGNTINRWNNHKHDVRKVENGNIQTNTFGKSLFTKRSPRLS